MAGLIARAQNHLRVLWQRAKTERATPRRIGLAIGLGVFVGCTPAMGFHGALALALATLFRLNRLFTWIGSRVSNVFVLPFIVLAELQVAHKLRTGEYLQLSAEEALRQGPALLLDWCIGTIPVGIALGALLGFLAYALSARRRARLPPPSSESPP